MGLVEIVHDDLDAHWVDRSISAEVVFFCIGASLFCTLAIFQKTAMNEDVTAIQGYILPFLFGGCSAALVGYFNRRSRRDLMARIEAQAERDILATASHAKSECMATMSHELRTPLNAIIGFSSAITNETFGPVGNDRYSEYIGDISRSGQHLLELINDILDVSAIEAGKLMLHEESINVLNTCKEALHVVQHLADGDGVEVVFDHDDALPALHADERRFKQILLNLMSNAIKFTAEGGTVTLALQLNDHGQLVMRVVDNGIGMDADGVEQAMSTFGQLDSHLAREHEGTGLGLPLTKGLIELHDGVFEIISEKGVGTTAIATFPKERTVCGPAFSI